MLKRLNFWWILGALVAAFLLLAAACDGGGDGDGDEDGTTPEASPTVEADGTPGATGEVLTPEDVLRRDGSATEEGVVRWGFMFELSGGILQGFGQPTSDGVKLAVQEINEAGGFQVGDTVYTIELLERDTRSDVQQTIAVATELVRDEGVNVIWGPATVGEPQVTPITQRAMVLHLCPCQERETTALSTVEQAQGESRWAFQTLLPFSLLIQQGARNFLEDWPDFKTMALLCLNNETGRDVCERTKEAYSEAGIEVVAEEYFPPETSDFSPFLTTIRRADPDYLFNFNNPPADAALVRQAMELGVGRLHIVVVPANTAEDLIGVPLTTPVTAGACCRQCAEPTSMEAEEYCERYRLFKGGSLPPAEFLSLLTYDYAYMLVAAMQQADTVEDTTAIAEALEQIHYDGVSEDDLFFNSRHLAVHGTDPCTVRAGGDITCEHVPPPPEATE